MAEGDNDQGAAAPRAEAGIIATEVACRLLMLSRQRLDQLAKDGWIARHAPGHWRLIDLVQGYIRFLRDEGRRTSVHAADSRVRDARAREIEIRTAERLGQLVAIEEHDTVVDAICGVFRAELSGFAARVTRDLPLRRVIEQEIHGLLERVAAIADANAARLEAGRASDPSVGADDARQVGDAESDIPAIRADTGAA